MRHNSHAQGVDQGISRIARIDVQFADDVEQAETVPYQEMPLITPGSNRPVSGAEAGPNLSASITATGRAPIARMSRTMRPTPHVPDDESQAGQNDDSQVDDLTAYGCEKIFTDTASGKLADRPEIDKALPNLREGDALVMTWLSRAMRSLKHLLALVEGLREPGVGLVVLKQQIDTTTTPTGRLVFHILGAIDEFQRELIIEVTPRGPGRRPGPRQHRWPQA